MLTVNININNKKDLNEIFVNFVEKFFENFLDIFCDLPFGDLVLFSFSVIIQLSKSNIL